MLAYLRANRQDLAKGLWSSRLLSKVTHAGLKETLQVRGRLLLTWFEGVEKDI